MGLTANLLDALSEAAEQAAPSQSAPASTSAAAANAPAPTDGGNGEFTGQRIEVHGTSRAELNGRRGTAASFDAASGRYLVELDSGFGNAGKSSQSFKLKAVNLKAETKADEERESKRAK